MNLRDWLIRKLGNDITGLIEGFLDLKLHRIFFCSMIKQRTISLLYGVCNDEGSDRIVDEAYCNRHRVIYHDGIWSVADNLEAKRLYSRDMDVKQMKRRWKDLGEFMGKEKSEN